MLHPKDGTVKPCVLGDEGISGLSLGVVSRFSTDSDSSEGEGERDGDGCGEGTWAPPGTPVSERMDERCEE